MRNGGTLDMTAVSILGNTATGDGAFGGGIRNSGSGTMTLTNSAVTGNAAKGTTATEGGGISNAGAATLTQTVVTGNRPDNCHPAIGACG